jgi:hypothetical protein
LIGADALPTCIRLIRGFAASPLVRRSQIVTPREITMPTEINQKPPTRVDAAKTSPKKSHSNWINVATYAALGVALVFALLATEVEHLESGTLIVVTPE